VSIIDILDPGAPLFYGRKPMKTHGPARKTPWATVKSAQFPPLLKDDWLPARRSGAACDDVPPVTRMNAL